jgi:FHA domain/Bacterial regulatory proteins, luxR family
MLSAGGALQSSRPQTGSASGAPAGGDDPLARHALSPQELKRLLALEREARPFLALREPDGQLHLIALDSDRAGLAVGRRAEMDVSIPWDGEVSALHAELQCRGEEWTIVDDGLSRNGTFLNGRRVGSRQRLRDGDRVRVGQTTIAFGVGARKPAQTTVTARVLAVPALSETQRRVLVALCRPYAQGGAYATPATNQQIAEEVFLSVDGVKMHLRNLFNKFDLAHLPQNQKRATLVERAMRLGVVTPDELQ